MYGHHVNGHHGGHPTSTGSPVFPDIHIMTQHPAKRTLLPVSSGQCSHLVHCDTDIQQNILKLGGQVEDMNFSSKLIRLGRGGSRPLVRRCSARSLSAKWTGPSEGGSRFWAWVHITPNEVAILLRKHRVKMSRSSKLRQKYNSLNRVRTYH